MKLPRVRSDKESGMEWGSWPSVMSRIPRAAPAMVLEAWFHRISSWPSRSATDKAIGSAATGGA